MTEQDVSSRAALAARIAKKRSAIANYLGRARPRHSRWVNTSIICSAVAAALTAGPAVGGQSMTAWLTETLGLTAPAWQLLCLSATVCSVAAAISTNLAKSHDIAANIGRAHTADAKLEGLEVRLELGHIEPEQASANYAAAITDLRFL